jgi:hypothetical protein
MKKYKIIAAAIVAFLGLTSCSGSWLEFEPNGSTVTQKQYDEMEGSIGYHVSGLYSLLNTGGGDDIFGQKSLDIVYDLYSSDMAMTSSGYGWFTADSDATNYHASGGRSIFGWVYHYDIIKNCNVLIKRIRTEIDKDTAAYRTDFELQNYYAQALTMRAYAYYGLYTMFSAPLNQQTNFSEPLVPYYHENSRGDSAVSKSSMQEIGNNIKADLYSAIDLFGREDALPRASKQKFDINVARAYLAKINLEMGNYDEAKSAADAIIASGEYSILPYEQLTTNGFNDIKSTNWIWGREVTIENTGSLHSFFSHVDLHTYGYAFAGGTKVIDKLLYGTFQNGDGRKDWFDNARKLAPVHKFFPAGKRDTYAQSEIDRDWLSDDVYLRYEEIYLIAAEAAVRSDNPDLGMARELLKELAQERYTEDNGARDDKLDALEGMDKTALETEIEYQWRIELWGEGRSLLVMRRFDYGLKGIMERPRGDNHFNYSSRQKTRTDITFQVPQAEVNYNPNIE